MHVPGVLKRKKKKKNWGGGGGEFFFPTNFFSFKNVPGVLKRMQIDFLFFGGGGGGGCLGRPTPPPGGRAGSENNTLLPMTMICDRLKFWSGPVRLGSQKLSSGNLGGGRRKKKIKKF